MFVPFFSPVLLVAREDERMYFYLPFRTIHLLFLTRDTFCLFCWPWVSLKRSARAGNKHRYWTTCFLLSSMDLVYVTPLTPSPLRGRSTCKKIWGSQ